MCRGPRGCKESDTTERLTATTRRAPGWFRPQCRLQKPAFTPDTGRKPSRGEHVATGRRAATRPSCTSPTRYPRPHFTDEKIKAQTGEAKPGG